MSYANPCEVSQIFWTNQVRVSEPFWSSVFGVSRFGVFMCISCSFFSHCPNQKLVCITFFDISHYQVTIWKWPFLFSFFGSFFYTVSSMWNCRRELRLNSKTINCDYVPPIFVNLWLWFRWELNKPIFTRKLCAAKQG